MVTQVTTVKKISGSFVRTAIHRQAPGADTMPWFERVPQSDYYDRVNEFWFHVLGEDNSNPCPVCFEQNWTDNPKYCPTGQKMYDQAYNMDIGGPGG